MCEKHLEYLFKLCQNLAPGYKFKTRSRALALIMVAVFKKWSGRIFG